MQKRKSKVAPILNREEIELRRWCIEQAIRWPTVGGSPGYAAIQGGGAFSPPQEANIIDRAERLLRWVQR